MIFDVKKIFKKIFKKCKKIFTPKSFENRLCYCRSEMCMKNTFKMYNIINSSEG